MGYVVQGGRATRVADRMDIILDVRRVVDGKEVQVRLPFVKPKGVLPKSLIQKERDDGKFFWAPVGSGADGKLTKEDFLEINSENGHYSLGLISFCPVHAVDLKYHGGKRCRRFGDILRHKEARRSELQRKLAEKEERARAVRAGQQRQPFQQRAMNF